MGFLNQILLRANSGMAYYQDESTGSFRKLIEARRIDASMSIEINNYQELGKQLIQHYPGSVEIRGTMELYICSTYFIQRIYNYFEKGDSFYFDLQIKNGILDRPTTSVVNQNIGYQDITLKNVLISNCPITSLGLDSSASNGSFEFTADGIVINHSFSTDYLRQLGV